MSNIESLKFNYKKMGNNSHRLHNQNLDFLHNMNKEEMEKQYKDFYSSYTFVSNYYIDDANELNKYESWLNGGRY